MNDTPKSAEYLLELAFMLGRANDYDELLQLLATNWWQGSTGM